MKVFIIVTLVLFSSSFVFGASLIDSHIRGEKNKRSDSLKLPTTLVSGTFQQDIDHFGSLSGQKFTQRFWIESSYASLSPGAPVLFHICGEGDCSQGYFLNDNAIAWAKVLGAHIVYLEHRYYGQSLPFNDLSTDHLQYLTLNNVIEDLATFEKWIALNQGLKGPWISLGGSYSGTISAIYRQMHPELVVGALASSAPMVSGIGDPVGDQSDVDELSLVAPGNGDRPWVYQACSTFGFWEAEGESLNSELDLPSSWLCQQLFGSTPQANYNSYNQIYDLPYITNGPYSPSQILFTYGSEDVWTRVGLAEQTNSNTGITIFMINGAGHHFDLNPPTPSDSQEVLAARELFITLAQGWLKL